MSLKIIFMGTPEFSIPTLRSLNLSHEILCVYTQPPNKRSRGQKIFKSPIHREAEKLKIPVKFPKNLNNEFDYKFIKDSNIKLVIVVAYGQIIPKKFLNIKNLVFLNVHASLLPRWRGAAPIQRSIMEMDKETGISIMKIEPKLDTGPYILQKSINIKTEDNFLTLSKKLSEIGSKLILDAVSLFEKGDVKFIFQNEKFATYAKKIKKNESKINWNIKAKNLIANINALNPNPGCWFNLKGSRIKIIKAVEVEAKAEPGIVLDNKFTISCSENAIQILELKKEGKKLIKASEFLKGNNLKIGLKLDYHV